jgi:UDP-glucose 4-epimerase
MISIQLPLFCHRDEELKKSYTGKKVLILGGDGFLGFHTARALIALGAEVSILTRRKESLHPPQSIQIFTGDIKDRNLIQLAFKGQDIIFDLAGSTGGVESNRDAHHNLVSDCAPHLQAFQIAAEHTPPPLIIFCSTRTVYGHPEQLPVTESHHTNPLSIYAVHKLTLENHLQIMHQTHGLKYLIFRLSNPYGPYPWQQGKSYGIINQFIAKAHQGKPITIYGDGSQLRDYIYINDVIETFIRGAIKPECHQEIFNLGGPGALSIKEATDIISDSCPNTKIQFTDWPDEYKSIETGSYYTDLSKLQSLIGNTIQTSFSEGVAATVDYYQKNSYLFKEETPPKANSLNRQSWHGKRVLVTGASGFLGSHLAKRLSQRGAIIGAVHRQPLPSWLQEDPQVYSYQIDLTEGSEAINTLFENFCPDLIYHFAAMPDGAENEQSMSERLDINLISTFHLLQAATRRPVQGFILGDSCKVFGNGSFPHREHSPTEPETSYAVSKLAAWHYCKVFEKSFNIPVAALRPTLIYGPGQAFNLFTYLHNNLAAGNGEINLDGGQQTRDPLFIDDAISAYIKVAEQINDISGRTIPIGGGEEHSVAELAELFIQTSGIPATIHCNQEKIRPGEILRSFCDNAEALQALSWKPKTSIKEGFKQTHQFLSCQDADQQSQFLKEWFDLGIIVKTPATKEPLLIEISP